MASINMAGNMAETNSPDYDSMHSPGLGFSDDNDDNDDDWGRLTSRPS